MELTLRTLHFPPHVIRRVPVLSCVECEEHRLEPVTKVMLRGLLDQMVKRAEPETVDFGAWPDFARLIRMLVEGASPRAPGGEQGHDVDRLLSLLDVAEEAGDTAWVEDLTRKILDAIVS